MVNAVVELPERDQIKCMKVIGELRSAAGQGRRVGSWSHRLERDGTSFTPAAAEERRGERSGCNVYAGIQILLRS